MSSNDHEPQDDGQAGEVIIEDAEGDDSNTKGRGVAGWAISLGIHLLFALIFWYVVFGIKADEAELPPLKVTVIEPPPKEEKKKDLERDVEQKIDINIDNVADVAAPINNLNTPLEEKTQSEEDVEADMKKGREEAVADSEMGNTGAFMAIGAGGGSAGAFGSRTGGGKRRALAKGGGSRASESAVDSALRWFMRHQSADGSWDCPTFQNNCTEAGAKCEPGHYERGETSRSGITGLVILCYLGAGYDHKTPSKYKNTVKKALEWMITAQVADGSFLTGAYNYEQAISVMAMAETAAMTNDPRCKDAATKGWAVLMGRRFVGKVADGEAWGWGDYATPDAGQAIKTSATAWCIQALKSMFAAGVDVGNAPDGLRRYLRASWESTCKLDNLDPNKLDPYKDMTSMCYKFEPGGEGASNYNKDANIHNLPGVALVSSVFIGLKNAETMERTLGNYIIKKQLPTTWPTNLYYLYYNTFGTFQLGGEYWNTYNAAMRDLLVANQRRDPACFDGSWDLGTNFANDHGRVLSTVLACLSLEVYYRYAQVHGKDEKKK